MLKLSVYKGQRPRLLCAGEAKDILRHTIKLRTEDLLTLWMKGKVMSQGLRFVLEGSI